VIFLSGDDYNALVSMSDCIAAVESAFRQHGEGTLGAGLLSAHADRGAFHIKTSIDARYFAAKLNANFPGNPNLPTIQGVLALFDATNGTPLAIMDSIELTKQRTAAASAVAAKYLARKNSRTMMIYGCGPQASAQLDAIRCVLPIEQVQVFDIDPERARAFAERHVATAALSGRGAAEGSGTHMDVIVTCTTSKKAFLCDIDRGTFVAAVGADNPEKSEIDPDAMRKSLVVADVLDQCERIGDLRVAIAAGVMSRDDVHAELGAIVAGRARGRESDDEIIIFDSTGAGFQDAAAASIAYERAVERGVGTKL
jgi:ornithine cyclodeaminase/alanine dehydrogenase-like protein (mu-crystallin family)